MEKKDLVDNERDISCNTEHILQEGSNKYRGRRDICPYCGIRIEDPMEFLRHVFLFHST